MGRRGRGQEGGKEENSEEKGIESVVKDSGVRVLSLTV